MPAGCDPGISGAFALLGENLDFIDAFATPVMLLGKNKHQVNAAELAKNIVEWRREYGNFTVYLENVHTMPGQGVVSSGNFMESVGVVKGILSALQMPFILVTPASWKKRAGLLGKEKDAARTLAQQLYPQAALAHKKDIGLADAILIARYGKKEE
jgi:crossover junction endodeoxyribonuclease RuvC